MTMSYSDIMTMVHSFGLPCAYDHFNKEDAQDPPFVNWLLPNNNPFPADDSIYAERVALHIELYTDVKNPVREQTLEAVLRQNGLIYEKTEAWLASERMYEVLYQMEVMYVNHTDNE